MKSGSVLTGANRIAIATALIFLTILSACGGAASDGNNDGAIANKTAENVQVASVSPTPAAISAPQTDRTIPDQAVPQATNNSRNNGNAQVATAPQPQIGSGGNDFFQFTQARAAISGDPDLKTTSIVIEVKAAVVTLSGTVENATQKSKAEQLVREVGGIKKVNNRLQIKN